MNKIISLQTTKAFFPSFLTFFNLSLGVLSLTSVLLGKHNSALYCILIAALLDVLDGRLARRWKVTSTFGANLDSLADLISFGLAPAFIFYGFLYHQFNYGTSITLDWLLMDLYVICVAWRLARFVPSAKNFLGVPAPLGAGYALFPFILEQANWISEPSVILYRLAIFVSALLMVSHISIPSGKGKKIPVQYTILAVVLIAVVGYFSSVMTLLCMVIVYTFHWLLLAFLRLIRSV